MGGCYAFSPIYLEIGEDLASELWSEGILLAPRVRACRQQPAKLSARATESQLAALPRLL